MKSTSLLRLIVGILITWASTELQAQVETYIVRNENLDLKYRFPEEEVMVRKAINLLNQSKRIEVIGDADNSKVATHLIEVEPAMYATLGQLTVKFIDSTEILIASIGHNCNGRVDMIATQIENSTLAGTFKFNAFGNATYDATFKYKDIGWAKGMKYTDEKIKNALHERLRSKMSKNISEIEAQSKARMLENFRGEPALNLFPYRLKVLEIAETDKDEAEKLILSGGTNADLFKRERLAVYTVIEKTRGKKKFEQFESLGRVKFENDDAKGGFCDVLKGKKEILAAFKAGKTIYASPLTPYTKSDESDNLKMAIMIQYPPNTSEKAKAAFYRTVRINVCGRKGITILEREKFAKIIAEKELSKQDKFVDNGVIDQMKSLGADIILDIRIKNKSDMHNTEVTTYDMNLTDVQTGTVQGSKSDRFTTYGYDSNNPNLVNENGISRVVMNGYVPAATIIKENLPPLITIVEITEEGRKQTAQEVLVMGDMEYGAFTRLDVYKRRMIEVDGEMLPRFEKIGEISERTEEGDGLVNCKVKEGEKEIFSAIKAGEILFCSERFGFFEKMSSNSFKALEKAYGM